MQKLSQRQVHAVSGEATDAQVSLNTSTFSSLNHQKSRYSACSKTTVLEHSHTLKMKTFSVAVAVTIMLTFVFLQESSAVPVTRVMINDDPLAAHGEAPVESWGVCFVY